MKKMKKFASLLLAVVMVLAMNTVAFAGTYTITINNSVDDYEYTAYQIFDGDLSEDETTLSNVVWGSAIAETSQADALTAVKAITLSDDTTPFADCASAADIAKILSGKTDDSEIAKLFAEAISDYVTGGNTSTQKADKSGYTISNLDAGYYLIKTTSVPSDLENVAYSSYILEVVESVIISDKSDYPTLDKEVTSTTDSSYETTADYSVNDDVPFTLIATLPSNYADYETYKLTFHDTMDSALSFNNDVAVTVYTVYSETSWSSDTYYTYNSANGTFTSVDTDSVTTPDSGTTYYTATTVASSGYDVVKKTDGSLTDTCTFEVQISNTNNLTATGGSTISLSSSSLIVVTFTAKLTGEASSGKTNKAYLTYSNNPNETSGETTGKTPEDVTTVFTFTLDISKVNSSGNPLEGAGFTLYKKNSSGGYDQVEVISTAGYKNVEIDAFEAGVTYYTKDGDNYSEVDTTTTTTPVSGTTYYVKNYFTFTGLGVGEYMLKESTTPNGYNTMEDLYFTITATTVESSEEGSVDTLTVTVTNPTGSSQTLSGDKNTRVITTTIKNNSGSVLPSTGGIGTTIFYIVGGVMVVGALVLLITRKRMSMSRRKRSKRR
ncbi:MAG: isopeptide-forming domain-containing fimbrial protein [Clostridiales bacterium]|nr:isopeptide-forming domain-containing fimbrial protein [Clostridiales bacterium]